MFPSNNDVIQINVTFVENLQLQLHETIVCYREVLGITSQREASVLSGQDGQTVTQ